TARFCAGCGAELAAAAPPPPPVELAEPVAETAAEPLPAEPAPEIVAEPPPAEPLAEPVAETAAEPAAEPYPDTVVEPLPAEPVAGEPAPEATAPEAVVQDPVPEIPAVESDAEIRAEEIAPAGEVAPREPGSENGADPTGEVAAVGPRRVGAGPPRRRRGSSR
ncbi:MAG TPA: hypothetical protein VNB64_09315, partial [Solirubrobacteraceae bacterium]|nr:hypothetical protein [Solirubrobacteraceae bacterium]